MATSWQLLTSVELDEDNAEIETVAFTPKEYLKVVYHGIEQSADSDVWLQFGTGGTGTWDSDPNNTDYTWRNGRNNNTDNTDGGDSKFNLIGANINTTDASSYSDIHIVNVSNKPKMVIAETLTTTAGSGNAPDNCETVGMWNNTSAQINILRVFLTQGGAEYVAGSTITVWGADDQPSTPFYPNLSNGTVFEETDTRIYYMWDGTDTWNRVATT